jgi:hypothetical protein
MSPYPMSSMNINTTLGLGLSAALQIAELEKKIKRKGRMNGARCFISKNPIVNNVKALEWFKLKRLVFKTKSSLNTNQKDFHRINLKNKYKSKFYLDSKYINKI